MTNSLTNQADTLNPNADTVTVKTVTQLVLSNNGPAQTLTVPAGTTPAQIAAQLGMDDPDNVKALDDLNKPLRADQPLTEDGTVNFQERIAGA